MIFINMYVKENRKIRILGVRCKEFIFLIELRKREGEGEVLKVESFWFYWIIIGMKRLVTD